MGNRREYLVPNGYYHLFNHGNADDLLFNEDSDYRRFLNYYFKTTKRFAVTYCYCLLPNHFHFLVRIKSESEILQNMGVNPEGDKLSRFLANQYGSVFNAYAKHYNKKNERYGSLFINTFKRKRVTEDDYLKILCCYIHSNPKRAGLCKDLHDWKFSSYRTILAGKADPYHLDLTRHEVLKWFDNLDNYIKEHQNFCNQP